MRNDTGRQPTARKVGDDMASISRDSGGRKRILFIGADGQRRAIRLGKVSERVAKSVCTYVESLAASARARTPWEPETAAWVGKLDSVLYGKLAAVGLVPTREPTPQAGAVTLGAFLDAYIDGRTDIKPGTREHLKRAKRDLVRLLRIGSSAGRNHPRRC